MARQRRMLSESRGTVEGIGLERRRTDIVISANSSWNIVNFRAGLIRALVGRGHRVTVLAPTDQHSAHIAGTGADYRPMAMRSSGRSPIEDGRLLADYYRILRELRPAVYLGFTAKPNIYGSLAARALGMPVINNISGLGAAFMRRGPLQWLVSLRYRAALARSATIFFQNGDDRRLFVERGLAREEQARLLPGSGVDVERFAPPAAPRAPGAFRFLLVARMLWDKGIGEFVEAARIIRGEGRDASFALLGHAGVDNRGAIPLDQLKRWDGEGVVRYLGSADDVRPYLAEADCVVLPSYYREGVPRSLIEAASMGKPLIAADEAGCREAVDDQRSGFLCSARSPEALAAAMRRMLDLDPEATAAMGMAGREKAVREFDERLVAQAYIDAVDRSTDAARSSHQSMTE